MNLWDFKMRLPWPDPSRIRGTAHLSGDDAFEQIDGVPVVELVREIEIGPCIFCGHDPGEKGMLDSARIDPDGVLRGTSVCEDCVAIRFPDEEML